MMPALQLLLSYGAGLATGLTRFLDPILAATALTGTSLLLLRYRPAPALWTLVALAGLASGLLALHRDRATCTARLAPGPVELRVRLTEPTFPDLPLAALRPLVHGCTGELDARWPSTTIPAGTEGVARGRWIPRANEMGKARGMLLVQQFEPERFTPTGPERLRNWIGAETRALFGNRAGTVDALLLNRRGGMAPELRDRYARAGLVHILSISGFHVGVIVAWAVMLAGLLTPRRHLAAALGVGVALGYVCLIGWPPPAARAALLAVLVAQARWRQRELLPLPLLAVTGQVVLLLDPWAALDAGAWLSVAALGGALVVTRWSDRRIGKGWGWRMLAASLGATFATAPITAALFGTVSLAGLALNFVAVPLAAVVVPGLILALVATALLPAAAPPLAAGAGALLGLLDQAAWWGGAWSGAVTYQPIAPASALPWLGLLAVGWWCISDGARGAIALRRGLLAVTIGIWGLAGLEQARSIRAGGAGLTLHFLDVGQGDAAVLRTPGGRWVLIDAGPRTERSDAGRRVVAPFLARARAPGIAVAVISHAHADHLGGLPAVLERFPVGQVLEPAELHADALYLEVLDQVAASGVPWQGARDGIGFELDSVRFTVLHPDTAWQEWQLDLNEDSAVLLVEYGGFRAIFPGDAGLIAEARLAGRVGPVSVLKVGHHGSRSATGERWLEELQPAVALISSGAGNRYGHPHAEVVERLGRHGTAVWRTDQQGSITVTTDGRRMTVAGRSENVTLPVGSLRAAESPRDHHRALHPGPGGEVSRGDR